MLFFLSIHCALRTESACVRLARANNSSRTPCCSERRVRTQARVKAIRAARRSFSNRSPPTYSQSAVSRTRGGLGPRRSRQVGRYTARPFRTGRHNNHCSGDLALHRVAALCAVTPRRVGRATVHARIGLATVGGGFLCYSTSRVRVIASITQLEYTLSCTSSSRGYTRLVGSFASANDLCSLI